MSVAEMPREAGKSGRARLYALAALVVAVLFVDRGLLVGGVPGGPKTLGETWPRAARPAVRETSGGERAPDLDPASWLGEPLSETPASLHAYPVARAIQAVAPPERFVGWMLVVHHLVMVVGAFALARRSGLSRLAAVLAAISGWLSGGVVALEDDLAGTCAWAWAVTAAAWAVGSRLRWMAAGVWVAAAWWLAGQGGLGAAAEASVWARAGWVPVAILFLIPGPRGELGVGAGLAVLWAAGVVWSGAPVIAGFLLAVLAGRRLDGALAWDPDGPTDLFLAATPRGVTAFLATWLWALALAGKGTSLAFAGLWAAAVTLVVLGLLHRYRNVEMTGTSLAAGLAALALLDQGIFFAGHAAKPVRVPVVTAAHHEDPAKKAAGPNHFLVHSPGRSGEDVPVGRTELNVFRGPYGHLLDGVTALGRGRAPDELVRFFGHWPPAPVDDAALLRVAGVGYVASTEPLSSKDWIRFAKSTLGRRTFYIYRLDPAPRAAVVMRELAPADRLGAGLAALRARTGAVVVEGQVATPDGGAQVEGEGLDYRVKTLAPGWLVFPRRFDRRWQVTCDGRAAQVADASGLLAVRLDAGAHVLALGYEDPGARLQRAAGWIWALALVLVSGVLVPALDRGASCVG